jgi:hypothetical protein
MASKTIEFGAIDQTAEPLCAKIAPTDNANRVRPNDLLESAFSTPGHTRHCNPTAGEFPGKNGPLLTLK